jgi:hypothetical protein
MVVCLVRDNGLVDTLGRSASVEWMDLVALLKMSLSCWSANLVCMSSGAVARSLAAAMIV